MRRRGLFIVVGVLLIGVIVLLVFALSQPKPGETQSQPQVSAEETNPQRLFIPRWFLTSLVLDGKEVSLQDKQLTLQFEENGNANGQGGCNSFGATFQATKEGKMTIGPVLSTNMACEGAMEMENAYFQALSKIQTFQRPQTTLVLASEDGKTRLEFHMPPK